MSQKVIFEYESNGRISPDSMNLLITPENFLRSWIDNNKPEYDAEDANIDFSFSPETLAKLVLEMWNATLRPHEDERNFVRVVEVVDIEEPEDIDHLAEAEDYFSQFESYDDA